MPKNPTGPAKRADPSRKSKGRHPLLAKNSSPHFQIWNLLASSGNKAGGYTAAQMRAKSPYFHPQVLSDLLKAKLVAKRDKVAGNNYRYVADEAGRGIIPQQVEIEIELYETDTGAFVTRTFLTGRQEEPGKVVRYLGSRKVRMDVPGIYSPVVKDMAHDVQYDEEPDPYDKAYRRAKKNAQSGDNVILEAKERPSYISLPSMPADPHGVGPARFRVIKDDDGVIIDG